MQQRVTPTGEHWYCQEKKAKIIWSYRENFSFRRLEGVLYIRLITCSKYANKCNATTTTAHDLKTVSRQTADKPYLDAFDHELELLKERIHSCALIRTEGVTEDQEEEQEQQQRQRKLGPGGLDPVEVYQSLPKVNTD